MRFCRAPLGSAAKGKIGRVRGRTITIVGAGDRESKSQIRPLLQIVGIVAKVSSGSCI